MQKILFFSLGVLLFSCKKLSEHPQGSLTPENFYQTQSDAVAAVTAVYSTLTTDINNDFPVYGRNLNLIVDNTSDNQVYSPSNTNPDVRALGTATYVATNDRVHKIYAQLYWGINRANIAIDRIPAIPATQFVDPSHSAANLVREARFIRALLYFDLVRLFGPVPLVLHDQGTVANAGELVSRTSRDSVYQQIIVDLDSATALPAGYTGVNVGRATSGAAHALLAKVYVTRRDWSNAVTELKKVITAGTAGLSDATSGNYGYDLFVKFSDAFQPGTKNGKEHVFSAQFNGTAGGFTSTNTLSSFTWSNSAYTADIPADSSVVHLFDLTDQRRSATFYDSLFNQTTGKWVQWPFFNFLKFVDQSSGFVTALQGTQGANSKVNFPVIRYAEVLLLYAEALNELNGAPTADAYAAINIVRARAYNSYTANGGYTDHTYDLPAGLSASDFRDAVFTERRKEFIQESQRWFDLVRRTDLGPGQYYLQNVHSMVGNPKAAATLKDTLFPIPQTEIDLYGGRNPNFKQNPGWE
ncbi:RagB/SusD family nutrient uptake outer membrane protein [Flavitalea sp. BT771]|uniref:RagB/SusD family nutrient uptake outer membrane protein n=1 Tax=Flavitalea sp. BT771 TaxID=3063329 RepID=UPI0026E28E03|nr:RagB/SusD family nutrient uptake outer membrane protein [Flavitalea sp. BT771]MDO6429463.1 RagB/SusD family nutrient uptake outer membrane protein [Flavitalea sp. BT771]